MAAVTTALASVFIFFVAGARVELDDARFAVSELDLTDTGAMVVDDEHTASGVGDTGFFFPPPFAAFVFTLVSFFLVPFETRVGFEPREVITGNPSRDVVVSFFLLTNLLGPEEDSDFGGLLAVFSVADALPTSFFVFGHVFLLVSFADATF